VTTPLEPKLTKLDLRVLREVPPPWLPEWRDNPDSPRSIWSIAERLRVVDVKGELMPLLRGLEHFGYIEARVGRLPYCNWSRLPKGDEAVRGTGWGS
jgi:hypothetical protein